MRVLLTLMLVSVALDGHAKTVLLTHMPLQWRPTSELASGTTDMDATPIRFETFQDVRNDKEKVGENLEDAQPKPVTTSDDVGAFVSSHMRDLFDRVAKNLLHDGGPLAEAAIVIEKFDHRDVAVGVSECHLVAELEQHGCVACDRFAPVGICRSGIRNLIGA